MKFLVFALVVGLSALAWAEEQVRYDNFKVYKVRVDDEVQRQQFVEIIKSLEVHSMTDVSRAGCTYEIAVAPASQKSFERRCSKLKLHFTLFIEELQQALDSTWQKIEGILKPGMNWTHYHGLPTIYNWLDHQVLKHPFVVRPYIIGKSYEGRPIKAVKVSLRPNNKAIFIESNIHAIEWIASSTSTCFLNNLLSAQTPEMRNLLFNYDWIFVPIANPDGFEYSHNVARLWRKNRKPTAFSNSSGICYGVDLNRNFNNNWGGNGYNIDVPCDHFYGGAEPESEPEVQALVKFVQSFPRGYIRMYLALHSYGNLVLLPYGHSKTEFPPNYAQMMTISKGFGDAAAALYGTKFIMGSSATVLYIVSGGAKDWAYDVAGIPYTATIELRDNGTYGFFLPRDQIQPVCNEFTAGIIAMVQTAKEQNLFA